MTDWTYQSPMRRWRDVEPEKQELIFYPYWPFGALPPPAAPVRQYQRRYWTKLGGYEWIRVEEDEYFRGV